MSYQGLYEKGISFEEFYKTAQDRYKKYCDGVISNLDILEKYTESVRRISERIYVLAVAENWCIDSIVNLPVVHWMESKNSNISFRIINTEEYKRERVCKSVLLTPTIILLDEAFRNMGKWVQYPEKIKKIMASGNQVKIIVEKKKYRQGLYAEDTLKEILEIIKSSVVGYNGSN